MSARRTPKIAETEWNFRPVPANQEHACLIWELARESASMTNQVQAYKQYNRSSVGTAATATKFTADAFYFYFKSGALMDYFPKTPWRDIPANLTSGYSSEEGLNVLLLNSGERQAFNVMSEMRDVGKTAQTRTHEQFMALAEPHIVPFRALVNISYTDRAIQKKFTAWLAGSLLQKYFLGIPADERPLSFAPFSE